MTEQVTPETCPEREYHGKPFRYCPVKGCNWVEGYDDTSPLRGRTPVPSGPVDGRAGLRGRLIEAAAQQQTVWREGDRIRRSDGTGYSDRVSDEMILRHIETHEVIPADTVFVTFARAVLAIRAFERASAEYGARIRSLTEEQQG